MLHHAFCKLGPQALFLHACCCLQKAGVLEKVERKRCCVVMSTEQDLVGVNMQPFRHIVYFDFTPGITSLGACGLLHASVTFFVQPSEHLARDVLRLAGIPLPATPAELREFHVDVDRGKRTTIGKVPSLTGVRAPAHVQTTVLATSCACRNLKSVLS
jgi:hypothetical protein